MQQPFCSNPTNADYVKMRSISNSCADEIIQPPPCGGGLGWSRRNQVFATAVARFSFLGSHWGQGFAEDCFEQATAFGLGRGELRFQPVAYGHQFVHLLHDAMLLGKREKAGITILRSFDPFTLSRLPALLLQFGYNLRLAKYGTIHRKVSELWG